MAREKPCLRCGYSLRQIIDARHCPECGLSVWLSLNQDDVLNRCNPAWVVRQSVAAATLAAIQAIAVAVILGAWLFGIEQALAERMVTSPVIAEIFLSGMYLILTAAGMLLLAVPEHRHPDHLKPWRRLLATGSVFTGIAGLVFAGYGLPRFLTSFRPLLRYVIWQQWLGVALIVSSATTLAYLRQLARRVPSATISHFCEWLMLMPALMLVFVVPWVGDLFRFHLGEIVPYVLLSYLLASCGLFSWLASTLRSAATEATRLWASESAGTH